MNIIRTFVVSTVLVIDRTLTLRMRWVWLVDQWVWFNISLAIGGG